MVRAWACLRRNTLKRRMESHDVMARDDMEEALAKDDIDFILRNAHDTEFLAITLLEGFKGYRNMTLDELTAEYRERKAE